MSKKIFWAIILLIYFVLGSGCSASSGTNTSSPNTDTGMPPDNAMEPNTDTGMLPDNAMEEAESGEITNCSVTPYDPISASESRYALGELDYDLGEVKLTLSSGWNTLVQIAGHIYYPAESDGVNAPPATVGAPFPVVLMLHGNHNVYRRADGTPVSCNFSTTFTNPPEGGVLFRILNLEEIHTGVPGTQFTPDVPAMPDATIVPSNLGYGYFAEALAKSGIVVVSIDGNPLGCFQSAIWERSKLIVEHIKHLTDLSSTANDALAALDGIMDMQQIVLAGHSRGAEGVLVTSQNWLDGGAIAGFEPERIKGVVAIAPTQGAAMTNNHAAPLLVILPAADGDVYASNGLVWYDAAKAGPTATDTWFKAQRYVHGANHNFFNTQWIETTTSCGVDKTDGDNGIGNGDNRLTRFEQQHYLYSIMSTFIDAVLRDDRGARNALSGAAPILGLENIVEAVSMQSNLTFEPLSAVAGSGFDIFDEYTFTQTRSGGVGPFNDTFFHKNRGLVGTWSFAGAEMNIDMTADLTASELSFRMAQVVNDANFEGFDARVRLTLTDSAGRTVEAMSDWNGRGVAPWYSRPPWLNPFVGDECGTIPAEKTVLETVRIPTACFKGDTDFAFENVTDVTISTDGEMGALGVTEFTTEPIF